MEHKVDVFSSFDGGHEARGGKSRERESAKVWQVLIWDFAMLHQRVFCVVGASSIRLD